MTPKLSSVGQTPRRAEHSGKLFPKCWLQKDCRKMGSRWEQDRLSHCAGGENYGPDTHLCLLTCWELRNWNDSRTQQMLLSRSLSFEVRSLECRNYRSTWIQHLGRIGNIFQDSDKEVNCFCWEGRECLPEIALRNHRAVGSKDNKIGLKKPHWNSEGMEAEAFYELPIAYLFVEK